MPPQVALGYLSAERAQTLNIFASMCRSDTILRDHHRLAFIHVYDRSVRQADTDPAFLKFDIILISQD